MRVNCMQNVTKNYILLRNVAYVLKLYAFHGTCTELVFRVKKTKVGHNLSICVISPLYMGIFCQYSRSSSDT
jgi:hypothetical protein